ncbi:MAG: hypothetical protein BWY66_02617 [bacterium ADurb.Bin374]|nr:MAG: hypothetical protein BWY66_02617 [bacterium ADurb.Bin374]
MNGAIGLRSRINAILLLLVGGLALGLYLYWHVEGRSGTIRSRFESGRTYAAELLAHGLVREAVNVMETALAAEPASARALALRRSVADICMDRLGDYEKALAELVFIKTADPTKAAAVEAPIRRCLDRLGRVYDVQRRLMLEKGLNPTQVNTASTTAVRFGNESVISLAEIEQRLLRAKLPAKGAPREAIDNAVRELMSERLLRRAAARAGIDRQPLFHEQVRRFEDNLAIMRYLEDHALKDVQVDEQAVSLHLEKYKDRYQAPLRVTYSIFAFPDEASAHAYAAGQPASAPETIGDRLSGTPQELPPALKSIRWESDPPTGLLGPMELDGAWVVYLIHEVDPGSRTPPELARQQARLELLEQKKSSKIAELIADLARQEDVRVIDESIQVAFQPASAAVPVGRAEK